MSYFDEYQSPLETSFLKEMVELAKRSYQRGWLMGTSGNFSLNIRNQFVWQSPSGICKGDLSEKLFIPVALESGQILSPLKLKPSEEMPIHLAIYRNIKDARAVVHVHSPSLVKATRNKKSGDILKFKQQEMQKCLGSVVFTEDLNITLSGNKTLLDIDDFSKNIDPYLNRKEQMVVLVGHGAYVWGTNPLDAYKRVEALEFLCESMV